MRVLGGCDVNNVELDLKIRVSRYMSYLLRHNAQNLRMDLEGFVDIDELLAKLRLLFSVDKRLVVDIAEMSGKKRFEIRGNKIRALYGHSISVRLEHEEEKVVRILYHGTTEAAAQRILKEGLEPMRRKAVHLSPTIEGAVEVGMRRTKHPVVLEINAEAARHDGFKFYKATDRVYLSTSLPAEYIRKNI
jgi:putative RNA 2'-phosphotransferase